MAIPFLYHWLPEVAEEVNVTELGWQNVIGPPAPITGVAGFAFTVTVCVQIVKLPCTSVSVQVIVVVVPAGYRSLKVSPSLRTGTGVVTPQLPETTGDPSETAVAEGGYTIISPVHVLIGGV